MRKPEGIRRLLLQWVPGLADDPTKLELFVDDGRIVSTPTSSLAFMYRYTLNIVVQDFAGDITSVTLPLLAWVQEQQPELLARPSNEPFTFKRDIADADTSDLSIYLELSERVLVAPKEGGGFDVDYLDEPVIADRFPDVCGVRLWQLFVRERGGPETLIAQTTDPDFPGNL